MAIPQPQIKSRGKRTTLIGLSSADLERKIFIMGKKGKRAAKGGDGTAKHGTGKARRERAAIQRDVEARIATLFVKLEDELKDVEMFGSFAEEEECPICFVPMPMSKQEIAYFPCCGKNICSGCSFAQAKLSESKKDIPCAFCRTVTGTSLSDDKKMLQTRADANEADAMVALAGAYRGALALFTQDHLTAMRLYVGAAEQGNLYALAEVAFNCHSGLGVPQNTKQAVQLATAVAKKGCVHGHNLLGKYILQTEYEQAVKHLVFAARGGHADSMKGIKMFGSRRFGLSDDEVRDIEQDFEDKMKLRWTEERQEAIEDGKKARNGERSVMRSSIDIC